LQAHALSPAWRSGLWILTATSLASLGVVEGCHDQGSSQGSSTCATSPTLPEVQALFTSTCAGSSCHGSGPSAVFPPLAESQPSAWLGLQSYEQPTRKLVVPGHPEQSYLYMKVSGTQGASGGALMPLGSATPRTEVVTAIHDWIAAGAPGSCAGDDAGAPPPSTDPNTLDQGQLFTCPASPPPASSPARIRRIDSSEWTYGIPQPLTSQAALNPFNALSTQPYSTYSAGVTIDAPTLDIYFQVLPEAPLSWIAEDPASVGGARITGVNADGALDCMYGTAAQVQAAPSDTCIDTYVDRLLTLGVLARAPTAAEHANLRALLVTALAAEGGDVTKRQATLSLVVQAAWLTSGALFRSELGSPGNDPAHRDRLSNEELGLAVGGMLSFHRPGAPMLNVWQVSPPAPDDLCDPWLQQISAAVASGSIQDPATIKAIVAAYGGGYDPGGQPLPCKSGQTTLPRRDLSFEVGSGLAAARGEYWLAPRITDFFRQWLGYGTANGVFKDTPGATSKYTTTSSQFDWTTASFDNLQSQYHGPEASLVGQLDDTVARAVIDATTNKEDVFKTLMTTRMFHLPSDRGDSNDVPCTQNSDCATGYSCVTDVGVCGDSSAGSTIYAARVYNVEGVAGTPAARWVELPAGERSGVLTHPAWLTAHGDNFQDDPSLVHRGKWVRQSLFCETVPGLELVMVAARVGPGAPTLSARDRVEAATNPNPTCMGCHQLMNSLGDPFEMYNAAGFVRAYDKFEADGVTPHPPDATSTITNLPDPALNVAVQNAVDFAQRLSTSTYARRCFIRQAFRYFMGRDETMADQCTLAAMETALDGGSFFDMLAVLASSDSLVYRTTSGGQP
jgi:hypothetical protein